eukprot:TRINITY_DN5801_c0_g1_i1.p1 TRINITY_DN5801_c0_g1~~TRINITY_DN5801_c0_g1_i1.p1  ORF type:complete len:56 (-),score=11.10 TRINITY_DN5801_c0_g1_i1:40-207(-)
MEEVDRMISDVARQTKGNFRECAAHQSAKGIKNHSRNIKDGLKDAVTVEKKQMNH